MCAAEIEMNRSFAVLAADSGTAFVAVTQLNLDRIFSIHHKRIVAKDNTTHFGKRVLQVPSTRISWYLGRTPRDCL
jgi:hypothetical protein